MKISKRFVHVIQTTTYQKNTKIITGMGLFLTPDMANVKTQFFKELCSLVCNFSPRIKNRSGSISLDIRATKSGFLKLLLVAHYYE